MDNYGFKDLYSVVLKSTSNIEIGNRVFSPNEVILRFKTLQIATANEEVRSVAATGGYGNKSQVTWDTTKEINFSATQGVLSKIGFSILGNAKVIDKTNEEIISIPTSEILQPDLVTGNVTLSHQPNGIGFIYNLETGEKLYENLNQQSYHTDAAVIVDYEYNYTNGAKIYEIGHRLTNGYFRLEGKMRLKDDTDGKEQTGILVIPKVKIASALNLRLGSNITPYVDTFRFIGYPVGYRGSQKVAYLQWLNDDIDSDF